LWAQPFWAQKNEIHPFFFMLAPHKGCRSKATAILGHKNIHFQKGDAQAKFWIIVDEIEITEAFSYNFTSANKRQVKKSFIRILI